jgi:hypothetical protein
MPGRRLVLHLQAPAFSIEANMADDNQQPDDMKQAALASLRKAARKNPKAAAALRALETGRGRGQLRQQLHQSIRRGS